MGRTVNQSRIIKKFNLDYSTQATVRGNPEPWLRSRDSVPLYQKTTSFRTSGDDRQDLTPTQLLSEQADVNRKAKSGDTGHEFKTYKESMESSHSHVHFDRHFGTNNSSRLFFDGAVYLTAWEDKRRNFNLPETWNYQEIGARAINATIPTKSSASLAQFLGELSIDGIPAIAGSILDRTKRFDPATGKKAHQPNPGHFGSEYLGVQFGWVPLISDLAELLTTVIRSSEIIEQFYRDNANYIRRRYFVPEKVTSSEETARNVYHKLPTGDSTWSQWVDYLGGNVSGTPIRLTQSRERVWFSGQYTYLLEDGDSILSKFKQYEQLANKLLGTRITPSTLYELAPWSWLADWHFNLGTIISNASLLGQDGLVLRYGYLMRQSTEKVLYYVPDFGFDENRRMLSTSYETITKERVRANPYGFGSRDDNLTAKQWSILGALGMTKAPRKLWD